MVDGCAREADGRDFTALAEERDRALANVLRAVRQSKSGTGD